MFEDSENEEQFGEIKSDESDHTDQCEDDNDTEQDSDGSCDDVPGESFIGKDYETKWQKSLLVPE